jgi:hypothetical protein
VIRSGIPGETVTAFSGLDDNRTMMLGRPETGLGAFFSEESIFCV